MQANMWQEGLQKQQVKVRSFVRSVQIPLSDTILLVLINHEAVGEEKDGKKDSDFLDFFLKTPIHTIRHVFLFHVRAGEWVRGGKERKSAFGK